MSDNSKKLIIAILSVTLIGLAIFYYMDHQKQSTSIETLTQEKEAILTELTKLEKQYDTAIVQNTQLSDELKTQKNSIIKFKDSLKKIKNTNWKLIKFYKNKIKNLTKTTERMIHINDSLVESNSLLSSENQDLQTQTEELSTNLEKQTSYNDTLVDQNLTLAKKVAIGEIVTINNFKVTTYDERNSGKFKETDKAKKVNAIKVSFLLNENLIAKEKDIVAYVAIKAPNGRIIDEKGNFEIADGTVLRYSEKTVIPYKTHAIATDIILEPNVKLEKGTYTIIIYLDNRQVAVLKKTLG